MPMRVEFSVAVSVAVMLAGCGGGGGGSSGTRSTPVPEVYPDITKPGQTRLTGQAVNLGIDAATSTARQLNGTVEGRIDWVSGQPKTIAMDFSVPAAPLQFSETFANLATRTVPISPGFSVAVSSEQKVASDGSLRSVELLNPRTAGLQYTTLGAWGYSQSPSAATQYDGRFILGTATRVSDIPVTGSASYAGVMLGTLVNSAGVHDVTAHATAQADFGARAVNFATDFSVRTLRGSGIPVSDSSLDLSGVLNYAAGSNRLSGTLTTPSADMSGQATARFYGPAVRELGGTYFVEKADKSQQMSGAFAVKR